MKVVNRVRKLFGSRLRARVAAGFAKIASAVDARKAQRRTGEFYRSSGFVWARSIY
jgi:hypothetical protein